MTVESQSRMLSAKFKQLEREIGRSNIEQAVVVDVDQAHMSGSFSTPVQVELRSGGAATQMWVGVDESGVLPPIGSQVRVDYNGANLLIAPRPGTLIEGGWESADFVSGVRGWRIDAEGNLEANDGTFRGLLNASGGPNLLENGDAEVDISGVTESAGTLSRETDTDETRDESLGAFKLVTASESTERFLDWPSYDIDPNDTLRTEAWSRGSNALNRSKIAIVWREADETEIEESEGEYVTVGTGYDRVVAQSAPPAVVTGFTDFQPNEDVVFTPGPPGTGTPTGFPNNTVGQRYQNIDEVALNLADYVQGDNANGLVYEWRANVGSGNLAGRTITGVEVLVDAAITSGVPPLANIPVALRIGGTLYDSGLASSTDVTTELTQFAFPFDVNPADGQPWSIADIEAFDTADEIRVALEVFLTTARIYRCIFRVHWQEDIPTPARASVRVYLDPEQTAVTTWRVDDVELRVVSVGTIPLLRSAASGRRWEIDNVDRPEARFYNDDDELIAALPGPHSDSVRRVFTGTRQTTSSSFSNFGAESAIQIVDFVKYHDESNLIAESALGAYGITNFATLEVAAQINGTDYVLMRTNLNTSVVSHPSGGRKIDGLTADTPSGVPAGTYTITLRWRRAALTGTITTDPAEQTHLTVTETVG